MRATVLGRDRTDSWPQRLRSALLDLAANDKNARTGGEVHAAPKRRGRSVTEAIEEMEGTVDGLDEELSFDD